MRPDSLRNWYRSVDPWARVAIIFWAVVVLVLAVRVALRPDARNLYPSWSTAGADWFCICGSAGEDATVCDDVEDELAPELLPELEEGLLACGFAAEDGCRCFNSFSNSATRATKLCTTSRNCLTSSAEAGAGALACARLGGQNAGSARQIPIAKRNAQL